MHLKPEKEPEIVEGKREQPQEKTDAGPQHWAEAYDNARRQLLAAFPETKPRLENVIIGFETFSEAKEALAGFFARYPAVNNGLAPFPDYCTFPIRTCHCCDTGKMHCAGANRLPDGRVIPGILTVCGTCDTTKGRRE